MNVTDALNVLRHAIDGMGSEGPEYEEAADVFEAEIERLRKYIHDNERLFAVAAREAEITQLRAEIAEYRLLLIDRGWTPPQRETERSHTYICPKCNRPGLQSALRPDRKSGPVTDQCTSCANAERERILTLMPPLGEGL